MTAPRVLLALLALTPVARAQVAVLPSRPFDRVEHVALPSASAAALLPRPGGGAAALLTAPSGVALLDHAGRVTTSWNIDAPPGGGAWWVGAETLHLTRGRDALLSYAVDGSLRGRAAISDVLGGVSVVGAAEAVISTRAASTVLGARVRWDLEPLASFAARSGWRPAVTPPCADASGAVWIAGGAGLLRVLPRPGQVAFARGVRALHPRRGGGLLALTEDALYLLDPDARETARVDLDAAVVDLAPRPDGGAALLLQTTPPSVLLVDGLGARRARFDAPRDTRTVTVDGEGAVLAVTRDGELAAFDASGTARWRMSLPARLRPPVIALSPSRYAVATEAAEVITLGLSSASPRDP